MRYAAAFPSLEEANAFAAAVGTRRRRLTATGWASTANRFGGFPWSSARRRELRVYEYQEFLYPQDRYYLMDRDPTAEMLCVGTAEHTYFAPPETLRPATDDYFTALIDLGLPQAATDTDAMRLRDGGAWFYVNATGDPTQPLRRGDEILGFDFIEAQHIVDTPLALVPATPDERDQLVLQHGYRSVSFYPDADSLTANMPLAVHGSRLFCPKPRRSKWWQGHSILDVRFDALWNLRDAEFAQRYAQVQGNPFVVEVDTEGGFSASAVDEDGKTAAENIADTMVTVREGSSDSFAPINGATIKRSGPASLDDPLPIFRLLASRIAHGTIYSANEILAMSRGSEQITDQDTLHKLTALMLRQHLDARPFYVHMARVGERVGALSTDDARLPRELVWPIPYAVSPEMETRIIRGYSMALNGLRKSGSELPPKHARHFPDRTKPFDIENILPQRTEKAGGDEPAAPDPRRPGARAGQPEPPPLPLDEPDEPEKDEDEDEEES